MGASFYFYDLETSGFRCRTDRIMQFAGQRTDTHLNPIGKPDNILIKMTPDVLPEPGAVLVHGITPQRTLKEGISETDFCKYLTSQVSMPDTVIVGYNNLRFDNEFIRFTLWRNFYDAYEWSWKNNCSNWDLLDVVRMTRALRPEGIKWPFAPDGKPTNSLEYLSAVNKLDHVDSHDAVSDVKASIALARLLKAKQPDLFNFLLDLRSKQKIAPFISRREPVIYTSGRYPAEFIKTTIAVMVTEKPDKSGALMYDLRTDPDEFKDLSVSELSNRWKAAQSRDAEAAYFPVKELKYNRCPAVVNPVDWLDDAAAKRLKLHREIIDSHFKKLQTAKNFGAKLLEVLDRMWPPRQPQLMVDEQKVDEMLYDSFVKEEDKAKMSVIRAAKPDELSRLGLDFSDERLNLLFPLYKARNFPETLTAAGRLRWQEFRRQKLVTGNLSLAGKFFAQIDELSRTPGLTQKKHFLLQELKGYGQKATAEV